MTQTYIVLGTARSGTSIMAGLLDILGVKMDSALGGADYFAPKGYFESAAASAINRQIFQLAWANPQHCSNDDVNYYWNPPPIARIKQQADNVKNIIKSYVSAFAGHNKWGFKNPATCLTIDLYLPFIENPHFIVVNRKPVENIEACSIIYGLSKKDVSSILSQYWTERDCVLNKYDYPRIEAAYDEFKTDHMKVARRLAEFCGLAISDEISQKLEGFVEKKQFGINKYIRLQTESNQSSGLIPITLRHK